MKNKYAVWIDPSQEIDALMKENPLDAVPYSWFVDANANIRLRNAPPSLQPDGLEEILEELRDDPYGAGQ
ncbi:MAG: hypothetical protein B7733_17470 [Myxococcales bacterium FL481]|nr:MAG: hypothetical protein B7733_17470 [Myxococcales bacterium FL481]